VVSGSKFCVAEWAFWWWFMVYNLWMSGWSLPGLFSSSRWCRFFLFFVVFGFSFRSRSAPIVFVVVPRPVRLPYSLSLAVGTLRFYLGFLASLATLSTSSFPGIPTWLGTQSSVILSSSCPSSFLIVRVLGYFVSFLSEAATGELKESVAMSFLPGSFIVEWKAVIIADCSALKILFCGRTLFF
jgi:hypothetical protein